MSRRLNVESGLLLAIWAAAIAIVRPAGDFPILDDWDFAIATSNFARTGHFAFTKFTVVSLRAQVLWGAAWVSAFGESFNVLRASTLVLSAGTVLIGHRTAARLGLGSMARVVAALALLFHPVFLWASCTYMTDVPYVFLSAVAMYCFIRDEPRWTAAGCLAALGSCFVRQTGVLNLLPPLIIAIWRRRFRETIAPLCALAVFGAIYLARPDWLIGSQAEFAVHLRAWHEPSFQLPEIIELAYHWTVFNVQNTALFLAPLIIPLALARRGWIIAGVAAVLLLLRVQSLISSGHPMPYSASPYCCDIFGGNILADFGLGPQTLTGAFPFVMPMAARLALTYASVVLGGLLIAAAWSARKSAPLPLLLAIVSTGALVASALYVDRYALDSAWSMALVLPFAVPWAVRRARVTALVTLAVVACFSIFSVQEYFAWNRARWQAYRDLRAQGVAIEQIDGGAEAFQYYELSKADQRFRRIHQFGGPPRPYTISFSPLPGSSVIASYPWSGWLGLHRSAIVVGRR